MSCKPKKRWFHVVDPAPKHLFHRAFSLLCRRWRLLFERQLSVWSGLSRPSVHWVRCVECLLGARVHVESPVARCRRAACPAGVAGPSRGDTLHVTCLRFQSGGLCANREHTRDAAIPISLKCLLAKLTDSPHRQGREHVSCRPA